MKYASGPSDPITTVEGCEGAGMGRVVSLGDGLTVQKAIELVKAHLGLQYGK
jgi:hypothetical protein